MYGQLAKDARCRHLEKTERQVFPRVGDSVVVRHHFRWRKGTVTRIKNHHQFYDVHLDNDGSWTNDELKDFKRLFDKYDTDHSGGVDFAELRQMLLELEHTADEEEVVDMFRRVDKDGTGEISFDEFCDLVYVEIGGIDHDLYDVPRLRLRQIPIRFEDPFRIHTDPYASLLGRGREEKKELRRRRKAAHLDSLSTKIRR